MEDPVPDPTPSTEAITIEAAYQDEVKALFHVLIMNLASGSVSRENDQHHAERFAAGLNIAKRAKELALKALANALVAEVAAMEKAAGSKKIKKA